MTFADYWQKLKDKNPGLANDSTKVTFYSVAKLRDALERVFNAGCERAKRADDFMDKLFGKTFYK